MGLLNVVGRYEPNSEPLETVTVVITSVMNRNDRGWTPNRDSESPLPAARISCAVTSMRRPHLRFTPRVPVHTGCDVGGHAGSRSHRQLCGVVHPAAVGTGGLLGDRTTADGVARSEEHTSELQSLR